MGDPEEEEATALTGEAIKGARAEITGARVGTKVGTRVEARTKNVFGSMAREMVDGPEKGRCDWHRLVS